MDLFDFELHCKPCYDEKYKHTLYIYTDFDHYDRYLISKYGMDKDILNIIGVRYHERYYEGRRFVNKNHNTNRVGYLNMVHRNIINDYNKLEKYYLMAIELGDTNAMHNLARCYMCKYGLLGPKIFKELTEYCFNPQRLTRLCNIYNIEMSDYMDII